MNVKKTLVPWTTEEDTAIQVLVAKHGTESWIIIKQDFNLHVRFDMFCMYANTYNEYIF
jgi:hypothetical protein